LEQPFSSMPDPLRSRELIDLAFRRARKREVRIPRRTPKDLKAKIKEETRITSAGNIVINRLHKVVTETPRISDLHPFYREVADAVVGVDNLRKALARIKRAETIVKRLLKDHLRMVKRAREVHEAARIRKAFYGRLSSVLKKLDKDLALVKEAGAKLRKLPSIDPEGLTVVVAGAPNVGKSCFVKCVSTAKPDIASYPFTTRQVLVGHLDLGGVRVQIIDTPGLLDRPIYKRNRAEQQAIAALRHLAKSVIFMIDPSETSGYTIKEQVNIYRGAVEVLKDIPHLPVLNKVDLASERQIKEVEDELGLRNLPKMVALRCLGVKEVLVEAVRAARRGEG